MRISVILDKNWAQISDSIRSYTMPEKEIQRLNARKIEVTTKTLIIRNTLLARFKEII